MTAPAALNCLGQLGRPEGFGNVVIGAYAEAYDDVRLLVLCGEQDDGYVCGFRGVLELAGELDAGGVREHDVEQDEVGSVCADGRQRLGRVFGGGDDEAGGTQVHAEQFEQVLLVIDNQYFGVHGLVLYRIVGGCPH